MKCVFQSRSVENIEPRLAKASAVTDMSLSENHVELEITSRLVIFSIPGFSHMIDPCGSLRTARNPLQKVSNEYKA